MPGDTVILPKDEGKRDLTLLNSDHDSSVRYVVRDSQDKNNIEIGDFQNFHLSSSRKAQLTKEEADIVLQANRCISLRTNALRLYYDLGQIRDTIQNDSSIRRVLDEREYFLDLSVSRTDHNRKAAIGMMLTPHSIQEVRENPIEQPQKSGFMQRLEGKE